MRTLHRPAPLSIDGRLLRITRNDLWAGPPALRLLIEIELRRAIEDCAVLAEDAAARDVARGIRRLLA